MRAKRSSGSAPATSELVTMAPALTIGLGGRPVPGSRRIELNPSPLGSAPTRARTSSSPWSASASAKTKGLDTDWTVNGTSLSPQL